MPMLAAANMDRAANPHPERLDLQRRPNRHIAFDTGIHFCLGHQLVRIKGRCALKSLFRRWPKLTLTVDKREVTWRKRAGMKVIERLPVVEGQFSNRSSRGTWTTPVVDRNPQRLRSALFTAAGRGFHPV